ncbi:hypothetical protein SDC9_194507 [bioreactor metagenome]|uniref:Uncharacterized protein n=1 Tax=bioreactor metagenome TaxID=1076179 RepID=A0A645I6N5_9ZZZZ
MAAFQKGFGQHHEAQTQRREQGLAEGAHIQHGCVGHQALHGADGLAQVAEFAVVIVLNDPCAVPLCVGDQLQTAAGAEHCAQRILV